VKVKLQFMAAPADVTVLPEGVALLCVDAEDGYYIGHRIDEEIEVTMTDDEGSPEEIDIRFVAILPDPSEAAESAMRGV
jgi:hypothetical protein